MEAALQAMGAYFTSQQPTALVTILALLFGASWLHDRHKQAKLIETYRVDMQKVLEKYGEHVNQLASYYERNVDLVKSWQTIAEGFQSTVVLNTQKLTELCKAVEDNQYCPVVKQKSGK